MYPAKPSGCRGSGGRTNGLCLFPPLAGPLDRAACFLSGAVGCELLLSASGVEMASFDFSVHRVQESASSDLSPPIPLTVGYRSKCY